VSTRDEGTLRALHEAASDRSLYLRYFSVSRHAGEQYLDHLVHGDGPERLAPVAEEHGGVVGTAGCERIPGTADLLRDPLVRRLR
jgi:hypothetical protein